MLINEDIKLDHTVELMIGAAPPPVSVLKKIQERGFNVTHTYGLTEVYGPAVVCEWQREWDNLKKDMVAELKSRQGVKCPGLSDLQVVSKKTNKPVNKNGKELGEVYMRGNTVMMGYYKDTKATQNSFEGGWFHTGDIGVVYENGYIQLKDAESGETLLVDTNDRAMIKHLTSHEQIRRENLKKSFHSMGVDTIEIETDGSLVEPIIRYFKMREKRH